ALPGHTAWPSRKTRPPRLWIRGRAYHFGQLQQSAAFRRSPGRQRGRLSLAGAVGAVRVARRAQPGSVLLGDLQIDPLAARYARSADRGSRVAPFQALAAKGAGVITSARYLSRAFLSRFALLLLAFLVLFEIFDMMATGDQVINRNNSILALFQYSALRI